MGRIKNKIEKLIQNNYNIDRNNKLYLRSIENPKIDFIP